MTGNSLPLHASAEQILSWVRHNHSDMVVLEGSTQNVGQMLEHDGLEQISACLHFRDMVHCLETSCGPLRTGREVNMGPYKAKHRVENWAGIYIPTDAWVMAGLHQGFVHPKTHNWRLNARVADLLYAFCSDRTTGGLRNERGTLRFSWTPSERST